MQEHYLLIRVVVYAVILCLWLLRWNKNSPVDHFIGVITVLSAFTDLLDHFIFTSNLELIAVYDLVIIGLLFYLMSIYHVPKWLLVICYTLIFGLTILSFVFPNFGPHSTGVTYLSDYGFLDNMESDNLDVVKVILLTLVLFVAMWRLIAISDTPHVTKISLLYVGFIILYTSKLFIYLLGRLLLDQLDMYLNSIGIIVVWSFIFAHILYIGSISWKKFNS